MERWAPHDKNMGEWKKRIEAKNPFVVVENDTILAKFLLFGIVHTNAISKILPFFFCLNMVQCQ